MAGKFVVILVLFSITLIESHMMMNHPSVWGINSKKGGLEVPLNSGTRNWFMAGARKDTNSVLTLNAGGSVSVPVTCGEAVGNAGNAPSICKGDRGALHGGGGCALSISYKDANSVGKDDFTIFSVNYRCPNEFRPVNFDIPSNLPACDDCVCAWTWIPSETASADEMYMNGFNCRVESKTQGKLTGGPKLTYFAVPGSRNPGFRPRYNNNRTGIKDGAQQLNVSGGGSSNNNNNNNSNSNNNNNNNNKDNDNDKNKSKGTCGNGKRGNGRCASGECCSQWGWCGTTSAHCQ